MNSFDERAKQWDSPERAAMASSISLCMLTGLRLNDTMTAVDFGAGTGLVTFEIAKRVKRITAIDSSVGMIDVIREKIENNGVKNVDAMFYDIEKDPAVIDAVDVIVSSMAMHHVKDIRKFAEKIYLMLKTGGQLAIADLEKEDGSFHDGNSTGVMHHGFDRNSLESEFKSAGFSNIKFSTAFKAARGNREYPVFLMLCEK